MMQTAEQIIETVRALPLSEKEKFFHLAEAERQKSLLEKSTKKMQSREEQRKFQMAMKWLDENRQDYLGQWVCLDGNQLISHGKDALALYKEAKEKGIKLPFVEHIIEEKEAYGGGLEACPQT